MPNRPLLPCVDSSGHLLFAVAMHVWSPSFLVCMWWGNEASTSLLSRCNWKKWVAFMWRLLLVLFCLIRSTPGRMLQDDLQSGHPTLHMWEITNLLIAETRRRWSELVSCSISIDSAPQSFIHSCWVAFNGLLWSSGGDFTKLYIGFWDASSKLSQWYTERQN